MVTLRDEDRRNSPHHPTLRRGTIIYEDQKKKKNPLQLTTELTNDVDKTSVSRIRRQKSKFEKHGNLPDQRLGIQQETLGNIIWCFSDFAGH